jgi:hypothetical protein
MERISSLGNATIAKCPRRKHWNCDALHQITRYREAPDIGTHGAAIERNQN